MNDQLKKLLLFGGIIGAGYYALNKYTSQKTIQKISLAQTRKITQQIKHQILIMTIHYAEGSKNYINQFNEKSPEKIQQLYTYFRTKLGENYEQKQGLILGKYGIDKKAYQEALKKYENDSQVQKNINQIFDMLENAVLGQAPNLTVDKRAAAAKTNQQIKQMYEDMSKMILFSLQLKMQQAKRNNQDLNSDQSFKKAIRQLNIYDKKVEFFKNKGFKQQWGCPNQNFFKISQGLKAKDPAFKQQMVKLEGIYEKVVDLIAADPFLSIQSINQFYNENRRQKHQKINNHHFKSNGNHEHVVTHNVGRTAIRHSNLTTTKKEQKNHPQQKKMIKIEHVQPINVVNLNKSTRSEQQNQQHKQASQIFESIVTQVAEKNLQQHVKKQESLQVQQNNTQSKKEQIMPSNIDDVPNDALELQKQMQDKNIKQQHIDDHQKKVDHQKIENVQIKHESQQVSNVSVDGESKQNVQIKNESQQVSNVPVPVDHQKIENVQVKNESQQVSNVSVDGETKQINNQP